jgi:uncharacterized protein with PIN domain
MDDSRKYIYGNSIMTIDFAKRQVSLVRSSLEKAAGRPDMIIPFNVITGIEMSPWTLMKKGLINFIVNGTRLVYKTGEASWDATAFNPDKRTFTSLKQTAQELSTLLNIPVLESQKFDVPEALYTTFEFEEAKIEETRMRCNVCGRVFCYDDNDLVKNIRNAKEAVTNASLGVMEAIGGTRLGAYSAQNNANTSMSKVVDYSKCPYCNSSDISKITEEEYKDILNPSPAQQFSAAEEIKKFKELLDAEIITQEEFDAKKKQLLGL